MHHTEFIWLPDDVSKNCWKEEKSVDTDQMQSSIAYDLSPLFFQACLSEYFR